MSATVYALAAWVTGLLAGFVGPYAAGILRGLVDQLWEEWQRDQAKVDAGAKQQRDAQEAAAQALKRAAERQRQENAARRDADIDDELRRL